MVLYLKSAKVQNVSGHTYYSDPLLGTWAKSTGVYIPPSVDIDKGFVNILLWLHGWYVDNIEQFFNSDPTKLRQQVLSSNKPIIVVAPYLGKGFKGEGSTYSVSTLKKPNWGELYIKQVLDTLALEQDPTKYQPKWRPMDLSLINLDQTITYDPVLRLNKLVIACHSGGGSGMRNLVGTLGRYRNSLAECWGFDCLYGANAKNDDNKPWDDANYWCDWANSDDGRPVFISYGSSTLPQSVKLDLMARGFVDTNGDKREPKGPEVSRLTVKLGVSDPRPADDLMQLDSLLAAPPPKPPIKPGHHLSDSASANLTKAIHWPKDLMDMHYGIARDGVLERLTAATFL